MTGPWLSYRRLAVLAGAAVLLGGTAMLSVSAVSTQPVSSAILGDEWQCRSIAFLTTCTHVGAIVPVAHHLSRALNGRPGV
jgi:hypothetical protein